jgi:H+/Cl- antiporter ClcA
LITRLKTETGEENDNEDEIEIVDEDPELDPENAIQLVTLRILGRPYSNNYIFWCQALPRSVLLGGLLAVATLGLFYSINVLKNLWFHADAISTAGAHSRGELKWILITSLGGLLSGLILLLPGSPRVGAVRTMFHDAVDLKGNALEALFVVIACIVCLGTGAPLGPEMALGALGSGLASLVARLGGNNNRRLEAVCVLSGMAGALGALFPSPILGLLLVHELSVTGRPLGTSLDRAASSKNSTSRDHDFMEQVTLMGTAATTAYVVLRLLVPPSLIPWSGAHDVDLANDYEMWHLAAAIPVGLVCGAVGSIMMILLGAFRGLRQWTCSVMHEAFGAPQCVGQVCFPLLAGLLNGLLAYFNPFLVGSGTQIAGKLFSAAQDGTVSTEWLMLTALFKVVSMTLSLGFGLVGGPLIPMAFVGLCIGLSLSTMLPIAMAVPCCMCAVVCSFVPIPFTVVFTATLGLSLSAEQIGPVFVSTFVAVTLTGGLGIVRRLGEKRLGLTGASDDLESHSWIGNEAEYWYQKLPSDNSVVRGVRSTIFGHMV